MLFEVRKIVTIVEEIFHDHSSGVNGPLPAVPAMKGAVAAVVTNPYVTFSLLEAYHEAVGRLLEEWELSGWKFWDEGGPVIQDLRRIHAEAEGK